MWQTLLLLNRRARYHWQMLLTLSLGVILATALMASGPILIDNVLALALQQTLRNAAALEANLLLTSRQPADPALYAETDQLIRQTIPQHFPSSFTSIVPSAGLRPVYPWVDERFLTDQRLVIEFYGADRATFDQQATFAAGSWPAPFQATDQTIAVVIGQPLAQAYNLAVGDQLPVSQQSNATEPDLWFEIAGIVQANDNQDPFWFKEFSPLRAREDGRHRHYSVLVTPESFFTIGETHFPDLNAELAWQLQLNGRKVTLPEAAVLQQRIANLEAVVQNFDNRVTVHTKLSETIDSFVSQADAVRGPLYFLVTTVVLLALYYVTMVASLGLLRLKDEFILLRSRGASAGQLLKFQLIEGLIISGVAFLSGPLIARLLIQGLAAFGPLAQINAADWTLTVPQVAWLAAVVGAAACLGSLLWPVPAAVREVAMHYQQTQTRVPQTAWWQRYYLDLVLLLVGLILLWRFSALGGLVNRAAGEGQTDWVIILAPIALLFGSATILLRLFPIALSGAARLASRGTGLTAALPLWQTARDPRHITRLVLLLTLTMALGIFATSLNAALDLNEEARARYAVGADVRLVSVNAEETAVIGENIDASSALWRGRVSFDSAINGRYPSLELLAIDPTSFNQVATYRHDFASRSIPDLLTDMETFVSENEIPRGYALPEKITAVGIWLRLPVDDTAAWEGINLDAKLIDADDTFHNIPLLHNGRVEGKWRYFAGDVTHLQHPVRLRSLWLRSRTFNPEFRENIAYDDLTVVLPNGEQQIIEDFEEQGEWGPTGFSFFTGINNVEARSGVNRLDLGFGMRGILRTVWYGIQHHQDYRAFPLPALISRTLQEQTGLQVGDQLGVRVQPNNLEAYVFPFEIIGVVDYFPTLYDGYDAGYLITLRDPLLNELNGALHDPVLTNELLVAQAQQATTETAAAALPELYGQAARILERETIHDTLRAFPMAIGLRSAALFGYILATVLSLAGFSSNFILSTRQRVGQYGILRALGLASKQLYRMLMLEQLLLIISGLLLGTVLGILLTQLTLANLNFSWGELASAPPFLATFDWTAVARVYLLLGIIFIAALALGTAALRRIDIYRTLRIGEE